MPRARRTRTEHPSNRFPSQSKNARHTVSTPCAGRFLFHDQVRLAANLKMLLIQPLHGNPFLPEPDLLPPPAGWGRNPAHRPVPAGPGSGRWRRRPPDSAGPRRSPAAPAAEPYRRAKGWHILRPEPAGPPAPRNRYGKRRRPAGGSISPDRRAGPGGVHPDAPAVPG